MCYWCKCFLVVELLQFFSFLTPTFLANDQHLPSAKVAATTGPDDFDRYVWEALRFHPISPYMFRVAERDYVLARGTERETVIEKGTHVLPLVGSETKFQPVYVDDVAKAAVAGVLGQAEAGVYELGGPDVESLHDLMVKMLGVIRRRRLIVNLPFWVGSIMAFGFGAMQALTVGLIHNGILTRDQVRQLRRDNVVGEGAKGFADLGIEPTDMDAVLAEYLWVYRPGGQYSALQDSARNLRNT